jgi:hypothetical protein
VAEGKERQLIHEAERRSSRPQVVGSCLTLWRETWLPVAAVDSGGLAVLDCAVPDQQASPIHYVKWRGLTFKVEPGTQSFGELVSRWIEAFDSGVFVRCCSRSVDVPSRAFWRAARSQWADLTRVVLGGQAAVRLPWLRPLSVPPLRRGRGRSGGAPARPSGPPSACVRESGRVGSRRQFRSCMRDAARLRGASRNAVLRSRAACGRGKSVAVGWPRGR